MRISSATLKRIMGLFILVVAPAVPLKDRLLSTQADCDPAALQHAVGASTSPGFLSLAPSERAPYAATLAGAGSIAGFLSGLMGIGGGIIVTPILAISSGRAAPRLARRPRAGRSPRRRDVRRLACGTC
mgnify:CR=1 FL=1|jgi:hypothetical protein